MSEVYEELIQAGGFEPKGNRFSGYKIMCNGKSLRIAFTTERTSPFEVWFNSPVQASEAIVRIGGERLKKEWFQLKD